MPTTDNRLVEVEAAQQPLLPTRPPRRPVFGDSPNHRVDPAFRDNVLFYEYFMAVPGAASAPRTRPAD
jgi:hypothetical protein